MPPLTTLVCLIFHFFSFFIFFSSPRQPGPALHSEISESLQQIHVRYICHTGSQEDEDRHRHLLGPRPPPSCTNVVHIRKNVERQDRKM